MGVTLSYLAVRHDTWNLGWSRSAEEAAGLKRMAFQVSSSYAGAPVTETWGGGVSFGSWQDETGGGKGKERGLEIRGLVWLGA